MMYEKRKLWLFKDMDEGEFFERLDELHGSMRRAMEEVLGRWIDEGLIDDEVRDIVREDTEEALVYVFGDIFG